MCRVYNNEVKKSISLSQFHHDIHYQICLKEILISPVGWEGKKDAHGQWAARGEAPRAGGHAGGWI